MGTSWMHYFIKKFNCLKFPSGYSLCSLHHRHCLYYFEVNVLSIHALGIFVCVEFLLLFNSYILKVTIRRFKKSTSVLPTYLRFFLTLKQKAQYVHFLHYCLTNCLIKLTPTLAYSNENYALFFPLRQFFSSIRSGTTQIIVEQNANFT